MNRMVPIIAMLVLVASLDAQTSPLTEKQKIESLIKTVEAMPDAKFVRNGSEYPGATAAKFLRGKWNAQAADVKTAADFIDKIGTASGTSGSEYRIRYKDGKEVKSRDFLKAELKKLE